MAPIRAKAHSIIDNLSDKKIAEVVDFLEFLKVKEEIEPTEEF